MCPTETSRSDPLSWRCAVHFHIRLRDDHQRIIASNHAIVSSLCLLSGALYRARIHLIGQRISLCRTCLWRFLLPPESGKRTRQLRPVGHSFGRPRHALRRSSFQFALSTGLPDLLFGLALPAVSCSFIQCPRNTINHCTINVSGPVKARGQDLLFNYLEIRATYFGAVLPCV